MKTKLKKENYREGFKDKEDLEELLYTCIGALV
jgi:hypothetical protein